MLVYTTSTLLFQWPLFSLGILLLLRALLWAGKIVRHTSLVLVLVLGGFRLSGEGHRLILSLSSFLTWCQEWISEFLASVSFRFIWDRELHRAVWILPSVAASLAALSARSFPFIPLWLGIHLTTNSPPWMWSCLARLRIWILNAWPALLLDSWSCLIAACESEKTVIVPAFLEVFSFKAIFKASDIPHNSASSISLSFPKETLRTSHLWEVEFFHTTAAPAPPDSSLDPSDYNAKSDTSFLASPIAVFGSWIKFW